MSRPIEKTLTILQKSNIIIPAAGTEYEYYFDELAEIEEKYYREFVKQFSRRENMVSDFFIHVICRTGWSYI